MILRKFLANCFMVIFFILIGLHPAACSQGPSGEVSEVKDFTLKDYNGKEVSLSDYKDSKAIVVIFVATECPVSNAYNSRMESLYNDYKEKGIAYLGINSNKAEDVKSMKEHAQDNRLTFTILKDEKNVIADQFKASVTPEVYVLSSDLKVLYHGRIDNSRDEDDVESKDLRNALDDILSGKKVSKSTTKAFGCTIKRV